MRDETRIDRRLLARLGLGAAALAAAGTRAKEAGADESKAGATHNRAAFQVSSEDRHAQGLILGNVRNYANYYKAKGEPFSVEIVAFGPGFSMVRDDISMMKGDLETLQKALGSALVVRACRNTRSAIAISMGKTAADIPLVPGVAETPSGVVRLAELQQQGWAYLRP